MEAQAVLGAPVLQGPADQAGQVEVREHREYQGRPDRRVLVAHPEQVARREESELLEPVARVVSLERQGPPAQVERRERQEALDRRARQAAAERQEAQEPAE